MADGPADCRCRHESGSDVRQRWAAFTNFFAQGAEFFAPSVTKHSEGQASRQFVRGVWRRPESKGKPKMAINSNPPPSPINNRFAVDVPVTRPKDSGAIKAMRGDYRPFIATRETVAVLARLSISNAGPRSTAIEPPHVQLGEARTVLAHHLNAQKPK